MRFWTILATSLIYLLLSVGATIDARISLLSEGIIPLAHNQEINGSISKIGEMDGYSFSGKTGNRITITLYIKGDALLEIFDPTGTTIAVNSGSSVIQIRDYPLEMDGDYLVRVSENGDDQTLDYAMYFWVWELDDAIRINPDENFYGKIDTRGDLDLFVFTGYKGKKINFTLNSEGEALIELFDPTGKIIAVNAGSSAIQIRDHPLEMDGDYLVRVSESGDDQTLDYAIYLLFFPPLSVSSPTPTLTYIPSPSPTVTPIQPSPTPAPQQSEDIAKITEVFVYYSNGFPASSNYRIRLYISANSGNEHDITKITITNPAGILIGDSSQSLNAINYSFPAVGMVDYSSFPLATSEGLAISGTYVVTLYNNEGQFETYDLPLVETDFTSTFPTFITPLNETTISDNPLISWESYVSPERRITDPDLNKENVWYHIPIYRDDVGNVWNYSIVNPPSQDIYSISYNQGEFQTGYDKLPVGSYTIAINVFESAERMLGEENIVFHRASVQNIQVDVSINGINNSLFDLDQVYAFNHYSVNYGNSEISYQIGLWGHAVNGDNDSIQAITIHNPHSKVIVNRQLQRNPGGVGCTSEIIPVSQLGNLAGEYEITVLFNDGKEEKIKVLLSETDFVRTYPVVDSPSQNSIIDPAPIISWPPFVSNERKIVDPNLNRETLTYFISWVDKTTQKQCWFTYLNNVPANMPMSVVYNFDGAALPGYESLPTGSYVIDFWCYESNPDRKVNQDVYSFMRAALVAVDVKVQGDGSQIPNTIDLPEKYIYLTSEFTHSLLRLDFLTGDFTMVYQGSLSSPHELVQNGQGVIYITNLDSGTVTRLESGVPPKNMFAGNHADGLSLGPNNSIYVAITNQKIVQLSDSGTILKTLTPPNTTSIHSMNYDQKDSVFVPANGQLFRYSISKGQWDTIAANVGMVNELTWDKEGNLLASNLEGLLKVYSPDGLLLKEIRMPSTHMRTVIQSSNGYYIVADAENNRILVTDEEGKIQASFSDPVLLSYPIGLLFPISEYQPNNTRIREWELY